MRMLAAQIRTAQRVTRLVALPCARRRVSRWSLFVGCVS